MNTRKPREKLKNGSKRGFSVQVNKTLHLHSRKREYGANTGRVKNKENRCKVSGM